MAKWHDDDDRVPERLARFVWDEWAEHEDPVRAWKDACIGWLRERPAEVRRLPFGPVDGGPADVLLMSAALVRQYLPRYLDRQRK